MAKMDGIEATAKFNLSLFIIVVVNYNKKLKLNLIKLKCSTFISSTSLLFAFA